MKLTMLGTGNALVTECYNTCFVIEDSYQSEKRWLKQPAVPAAQRPLANASAAAGRRKMHIECTRTSRILLVTRCTKIKF